LKKKVTKSSNSCLIQNIVKYIADNNLHDNFDGMSDLKTKINCDVLIVGAGPAGASLAYYLSGKNLDVILVEKKSKVENPVRCAELVPAAISAFFDFKISGINRTVDFMDTFVCWGAGGIQGSEKVLPPYKCLKRTRAPGFMLDRDIFVGDLCRRFADRGGLFLSGSRILSVDSVSDNNGSAGAVIDGGGNLNDAGKRKIINIDARIIAGADGPLSSIGKLIGRTNRDFMVGFQEKLPASADDTAGFYFCPFFTHGYGWVFPKKDYINIGVGVSMSCAKDIKSIYSLFKNDLLGKGLIRIKQGIIKEPGPDKQQAITGLIPVSGMVTDPAVNNFVLVGDAAGLTNPITGAGIYNAIYSAKLASEIIIKSLEAKDPDVPGQISQVYQKEFGTSLNRALAARSYKVKNWPAIRDPECTGNAGEDFEMLIKKTWPVFREYYK
jgi:digeranylgeranylglycerophospholipid reductase